MAEYKEENIETCEICGAPTGRAGEGEDSLYAEWAYAPPNLPSRQKGTQAGPFCLNCYDCLYIVGLLKDER